jgi:hypothetical protein
MVVLAALRILDLQLIDHRCARTPRPRRHVEGHRFSSTQIVVHSYIRQTPCTIATTVWVL